MSDPTKDAAALLDCPFCGFPATPDAGAVWCYNRDCAVQPSAPSAEAWNRRATPPQGAGPEGPLGALMGLRSFVERGCPADSEISAATLDAWRKAIRWACDAARRPSPTEGSAEKDELLIELQLISRRLDDILGRYDGFDFHGDCEDIRRIVEQLRRAAPHGGTVR